MAKVLHGNSNDGGVYAVSPSEVNYNLLNQANIDDWTSNTSESSRQYTYQVAGTLSGLSARVNSNSLSTATLTITSRKNTGAGSQTLSITAGQTGWFTDSSNSDSISAGDEVGYQDSTAAGGSGSANITIVSANFAATSGHSIIWASSDNSVAFSGDSATRYVCLAGRYRVSSTVDDNDKFTIRAGGTLKQLSVNVPANARVTTSTIRSRINAANGNQTISVTAGSTGIFQDTSNTDTVASGDTVNASITLGTGTGTDFTTTNFGATFTSSGTDNDIFAAQAAGDARAASGTASYYPICGAIEPNGDETVYQMDHNFACTASKMRVYLSANTYTGAATMRFRKNTGNGNQTLSITASTTGLFEDTTNSDSIAATDDCAYSIVGGTANSITINWFGMLETVSTSTTLNLSEAPSIIERLTRAWTAPRSQSEVLVLQSEGTTRAWTAVRGNQTEFLSITEILSASKDRIIEILETLGITESFSRTWTAVRSFSESPGIIEVLTRVFTRTVLLLETVVITETIAVNKVLAIVISNFVDIIEYVRTPLNWIKRTRPTTTWTPRTKP